MESWQVRAKCTASILHSCVTPTMQSAKPNATQMSVADGSRQAMRSDFIVDDWLIVAAIVLSPVAASLRPEIKIA